MNSAIFSVFSDCYQVSNVIYAGPVAEIPQDKRKGESTHSFRMVTPAGSVFCRFKDQDSAVKARGALGAMMESTKPQLFRSGRECLDPAKVISYSRVVALKNTEDGMTHGFVVNVGTVNEKSAQIWFTYRSEENAEKARKALFAKIMSLNGSTYVKPSETASHPAAPQSSPAQGLPF